MAQQATAPLTFVSGNTGKFREVAAEIPELVQQTLDLPEPQSLDAQEIITAKLHAAIELGYRNVIVEDTSVYFDGMGGLPGPLIKWFLVGMKLDSLAEFGMKFAGGKAVARTLFGYCDPAGAIHFASGEVEGLIVTPRGSGFGWDPIFQPLGSERTFGEMSLEEKRAYSHRARAIQQLIPLLRR